MKCGHCGDQVDETYPMKVRGRRKKSAKTAWKSLRLRVKLNPKPRVP